MSESETRRRCEWVGTDPAMTEYHDTEWGAPVHDDLTHFEFLVLEGAQAGLELVDHPETSRRATGRPSPASTRPGGPLHPGPGGEAAGGPRHHPQPGQGGGHGPQRRAFLAAQEEYGSFDAYVWDFVDGAPKVNRWRRMGQVPADVGRVRGAEQGPASAAPAFGFVGPTIVYAHMQATGLVNDHLVGCFRYAELTTGAP